MSEAKRLAAIVAHFDGRYTVCSFAKRTSRVVLLDSEPRPWQVLRDFAKDRNVLYPSVLLVLAPRDGTWQETQTWARERFLRLLVESAVATYGSAIAESAAAMVARTERPILYNDEDPRRVHAAIDGRPVMTICMAPCYPIAHPRYAPHTVLVCTWHADIDDASQHKARVKTIRARMLEQHGFVYDANDLVLPLPEPR